MTEEHHDPITKTYYCYCDKCKKEVAFYMCKFGEEIINESKENA